MGTTDKYDADRFTVGVTGWQALLDSNVQLWDAMIQTYLRYRVANGEVITAKDPILLVNREWKQSWDTPGRWPPAAVATESKVSGEWLRGRRAGEIENDNWSLTGSGEVWVGPGSGEVTQTRPGSQECEKKLGVSVSSSAIVIQL